MEAAFVVYVMASGLPDCGDLFCMALMAVVLAQWFLCLPLSMEASIGKSVKKLIVPLASSYESSEFRSFGGRLTFNYLKHTTNSGCWGKVLQEHNAGLRTMRLTTAA